MKKIALAALVALGLTAAPALAKDGVKIGVLTCDVSGGVGMIIGSKKSVDCVFEGTVGKRDHYKGSIGKFGLDVGVTGKGVMAWAVFGQKPTVSMIAGFALIAAGAFFIFKAPLG